MGTANNNFRLQAKNMERDKNMIMFQVDGFIGRHTIVVHTDAAIKLSNINGIPEKEKTAAPTLEKP